MQRKRSLKNTYSTSKNIFRHIQETLLENGASEVAFQSAKGDGKITGVTFSVMVRGRKLEFKMPVNVAATRQVLLEQAVTPAQRLAATFDKAYQVAWATMRDAIDTQMALIRIGAVTVQQVFLPYLLSQDGELTLYDVMESEQFLLSAEPVSKRHEGEISEHIE